MSATVLRHRACLYLAACLLGIGSFFSALPALSQVGHPAKGSWSGYLLPEAEAQERIRLLVDDHDGTLSATINPGRRSVSATSVTLDAESWTLHIEADTPDGPLVLTGTLSNLGSWTNRQYTGRYTLGDGAGEFRITLN